MKEDSLPAPGGGGPGLAASRRSVAPEPLQMTGGQLADLIRTLPKQTLTLAFVYIEDEYETQFGDGYYSDPHRAFFSTSAAARCAAWINWRSTWRFGTHGHHAEVKLGEVMFKGADGRLNWHEDSLLELINGNEYDWVTIVETYRGDGALEPDFGDIAPTPQAIRGGELLLRCPLIWRFAVAARAIRRRRRKLRSP